MTIRVLLVDDQPLVRAGVAMILTAADDVEVVGECGDGQEALERVHVGHPDVVLMDVRMPGMDGVEATRVLVAEQEGRADALTKVLVLTTFDDEEALLAVLRAGASGFVLKHNAPADLAEAVRQVAGGNAWIDPSVAPAVIDQLTAPGAVVQDTGLLASLTPREREILGLIARGLSNAEISRALGLSEATVKTHVSRVLMKCGCRDRAQAVVVAYESGLVRPGEPG